MIGRTARHLLGVEPPDPHPAEHEAAGAVAGERVVAVGYHRLPVLKRPHWKWHVPLYFFVSGLAGAAYLVATVAEWSGSDEDRPVVSAGRYLALGGVLATVPLLIDDLGRPTRFHHMLRTFKPRSPMSMGAWALLVFGAIAGLSAASQAAVDGMPVAKWLPLPTRRGWRLAVGALGAPLGAFLGSYTGVLLAATAVPLWARARAFLGPIFFCSGASTALAAISLFVRGAGARGRLRDLELLALAGELLAFSGALRALGPLSRPLVARPYGKPFWAGSIGAGQVAPLLLHGRHLLRPARHGWPDTLASFLVLGGGLLTRWLIVEAGKRSADDPQAAFLYHR